MSKCFCTSVVRCMTCYRFHEHGVIVFSEIVLFLFLNEMAIFTHEIAFQHVLIYRLWHLL